MIWAWICPILGFAVAYAVLLLFLKTPLRRFVLDQPNHRSLHTTSIPRTGGIAVMAGFMVSISVMQAWLWLLPLLALLTISLLDDFINVSVGWRFLIQLAVSVCFVIYLLPEIPSYWLIALILGMVWMINLYNFMDGADGLAGGMAVFGFGSYAIAAWLGGDAAFALLSLSVVGAAMAFLRFNFNPAQIFLGDSGSVPLGFLAAAFGMRGWMSELWPLWFPLLVFSPFILDASLTLFKRTLRREKIWQAHRTHYYQRLVQLGWGHKNTALAEYALMLSVGASAIIALHFGKLLFPVLTMWAIIYWILINAIDKRWVAFVTNKSKIFH